MPLTFHKYQDHSLLWIRFLINSHQLYLTNTQILLLVNCSISHLLFQTWISRTTSPIHDIASVTLHEPHGHVITGDLMVIENVKLRELVSKGPKYREPNKINWKSTKTVILDSVDLCAEQWSKREQVNLKYLSEWKDQIKELVVERIPSLKENI